MRFSFLSKKEVKRLPQNPGVYCFKDEKGKIVYIGKAGNIRERVRSHFLKSNWRDNLFIGSVLKVGYLKAGSEIEALILEANLIKKYGPKYNVIWRDDKNYFFVAITKEIFPRVFLTHQKNQFKIESLKLGVDYIGPFVDGKAIKKVLKFLRKIFPYYTTRKHPKNLCPWCYLGICPGPNPNRKSYLKNIRNLKEVLKGKRVSLINKLRREMKAASNNQDFEKAAKIRDQVMALENIFSHARFIESEKLVREKTWSQVEQDLKKIISSFKEKISRIEAYDVSNIQGQEATGSMVSFWEGKPDKNSYRKFKIRISGKPNDTAMLKEVLERRFNHPEWKLPDLILIDGGKAQLNAALEIKKQSIKNKQVGVMALAKKKNELFVGGKKKPFLLEKLPREIFNLILQLRDEAHRFALSYHKKLRARDLLSK